MNSYPVDGVVDLILDRASKHIEPWNLRPERLPAWADLKAIMSCRALGRQWKAAVECRVQYQALRLAVFEVNARQDHGWVPFQPNIRQDFVTNFQILSRRVLRGIPAELNVPWESISIQNLAELRDLLA